MFDFTPFTEALLVGIAGIYIILGGLLSNALLSHHRTRGEVIRICKKGGFPAFLVFMILGPVFWIAYIWTGRGIK